MLKLSFVLPCYNVERYIADCLDSIYAQDMSEDEYEVICVNDCSTDGTRSLIVVYSLKHSNLTLIDHEQNMTVGGARNTGLGAAKGEYVWFVDADDMIVPNTSKLYKIVEAGQIDILLFNFEKVYENCTHKSYEKLFLDSEICAGEEFINKYFPRQMAKLGIVWRSLFKRVFIVNNGLTFPKMIKGEDSIFVYNALLCARRMSSISDICYIYRGNPYSSSEARFLTAKRIFHEHVLFGSEICNIIIRFTDSITVTVRDELEQTIRWCINGDLRLVYALDPCEKKKFYKLIKSNKKLLRSMACYMSNRSRLVHFNTWNYPLWMVCVSLFGLIRTLKDK